MPLNIDISTVISSTGVAVPISAVTLRVASFVAQAKRANSASIYIGGAGVKNDGTLGLEISAPTAGVTPDSFSHSSSDGAPIIDLNEWYINGTSTQGVNVKAVQR